MEREKASYKEMQELISSNNLELIKIRYKNILEEIRVLEQVKIEFENLISQRTTININTWEKKANLLEEIWIKLYHRRNFISMIEKRIYHFFYGAKVKYKDTSKKEIYKVYKLCEHANLVCTCADFSYLTDKITVKDLNGIEIAIDKTLLERAE